MKKQEDMEVSFVRQGASYVAEFEAPADFNLHLERTGGGIVRVYQRGCPDGEYELAYTSIEDKVFDKDMGALVYPKWIRVSSSSEVLSASVNFGSSGSGSVGGSGSGEGSGDVADGWEYFDLSSIEDERKFIFLDS